ncbi:fetuin B [Limanda limanda]|uniref:fetuin B n=1 Tax=Limanda limanda TaxID=27771 RepID=UPI0029C8D8CF|nr:fetuin B [Limanda limanda]
MNHCVLLLLALGVAHVLGAPVEQVGPEPASCDDAFVKSSAKEALKKINGDRKEGYVFALHHLSNAHLEKHGENGVVFYLTMDVVETNCSVLDRDTQKPCEARSVDNTPVYGQCKAAIFISRVNRVLRLYKYDCSLRPVPAARVTEICPDCPNLMDKDDAEIQKVVSAALEKFNKESDLTKQFALLQVTRASLSMGMAKFYNVEFTIQETTCNRDVPLADKCPMMDCEFTHKGFCKGGLVTPPTGVTETTVECDIYEPEVADREKKLHLLGGETDHTHEDKHAHNPVHDHAHGADHEHSHDHEHDHTKSHSQQHQDHNHTHDGEHHHTHDHEAGSAHRHAHDHSHDHGHGHDHVHTHHAKAHNHTGDAPHQHHGYEHAGAEHTHEHDHEIALDHEHKHAHLHEHEHHHHHHEHEHEHAHHDHPEGKVKMLPSIERPVTLPFFPDAPEAGVTLPAKPDPQIPGAMEPTIHPFPTAFSAQCPAPTGELSLVDKLFTEDPLFKRPS